MLKAARGEEQKRFELRVVPLPAGSDPAEVLQRDGPGGLPALIARAMPFVRFRVERILAAGDVGTPEGRDRVLAELAPVFAKVNLGAMREELEREVASRLGVSEKAVEQLLAGARRGSSAAGRPLAVTTPSLDIGERTERGFLALCIALPDRGGPLLGEIDLDASFSNALTRAAAKHLAAHIDAPAAGIDDPALVSLLAELSVRASTLVVVPAHLEVERRQLELARIERAIDAARAGGGSGMTQLGHEREAVKGELDLWLTRALEETSASPR
jgi:DNA primase